MSRVVAVALRASIVSGHLLLAACGGGGGGGGGGGSQNPPPPPPPPANYTVGGSVSGLAGNSVTLRLNGGADFVIAANGNFTFPGTVVSGAAYTVTVRTNPTAPSQTCALSNATGNIAANVSNVTVTCTTNTYRVGGTLTGLGGGSVVLRNSGGDDLTLSANGAFQFATAVASGGAYTVVVQSQPLGPSQNCVVTQGAGTVAAGDVIGVLVHCTTDTFSVGGTVTGLSGAGLVLRNNGGNDLAVNSNGAFTFSAPVVSGGSYLVTVRTQPAAKHCTVANGGGTVLAANIASVTVTCVNRYTIGGTVRGLDVPGLVLRNSGGDDLTVSSNGAFTFATPVPLGGAYNVTSVAGTPASPRHVCQVAHGAGTVSTNANVTNVEVTCEADRFAFVAHTSTVSFDGPGLVSAYVQNFETGALSPIGGASTIVAANGAVQIVSDPRGRFIYVAHTAVYTQQGSIAGYRVNPATGALTPVPGSPFTAGMATSGLATDSEGVFLYASNTNSDDISGWVIAGDGSLTPIPGMPLRLGDANRPVAVATSVAHQCCSLYVAHSSTNGVPQVSAFAYDPDTGRLTALPGSPYSAGINVSSPASLQVNTTGEFLYVTHPGTRHITTWAIAGGSGALTQLPGSPTDIGYFQYIMQPRLSQLLFAAALSDPFPAYLLGQDADNLPTFLDRQSMFRDSYSIASDLYGEFIYFPQFSLGTPPYPDYLFGFRIGPNYNTLLPLTLDEDPLAPANTYTLAAQLPRSMVIRYSRRDREVLGVTDNF